MLLPGAATVHPAHHHRPRRARRCDRPGRGRGYATEIEELAHGRACVAAPIRDGRHGGRGLSVSGPLSAIDFRTGRRPCPRRHRGRGRHQLGLGYHGPTAVSRHGDRRMTSTKPHDVLAATASEPSPPEPRTGQQLRRDLRLPPHPACARALGIVLYPLIGSLSPRCSSRAWCCPAAAFVGLDNFAACSRRVLAGAVHTLVFAVGSTVAPFVIGFAPGAGAQHRDQGPGDPARRVPVPLGDPGRRGLVRCGCGFSTPTTALLNGDPGAAGTHRRAGEPGSATPAPRWSPSSWPRPGPASPGSW